MKSFTVITPVYNGEKFIKECVEHILSMNYDKNLIEHIIIDDGSTDSTKQICLELANSYKHIKFYSKPNGNWGSAINYVKNNHLVSNDYLVICDADDYLDVNAFNVINEKNDNADIVVGNYRTFTNTKVKGKCFNYFYAFRRAWKNNKDLSLFLSPTIAPTCIYIKKEIFYQTPDLTEGVMYQDTVLYMNCMKQSHHLVYTPKTISFYRKEQANNTMAQRFTERGVKSYDARFKAWMEKDCIENMVFDLMFAKPLRKQLINSNKTFTFKRKPCFKIFPMWMRIFVALIYKVTCKKIIFVDKK